MDTVASSIHWDRLSLVPCTSVSSLQASWFFTHTQNNFGDPHAVSGDSEIPLGCGDAVRLFFSMARSAGTGLWCSRSRLGLLLRSAGISVAGCVQRGRFWGVF